MPAPDSDRPPARRVLIALAVYGMAVAFVVFWPIPVDRPFQIPLFRFLHTLSAYGIRPIDAYNALESVSNAIMFVPAGLLLVLLVGRRRWWLAPLAGLIASTAIEACQALFLPDRFASAADIVANTTGALAGAGLGVLILGRRSRRRRAWREPGAPSAVGLPHRPDAG
jgi:glycopeptide antibiotics resistance protein